jgi:hypothetical protein
LQRDYKRVKAGVYSKTLDAMLNEALALLAADQPLPARFRMPQKPSGRATPSMLIRWPFAPVQQAGRRLCRS